MGIKNSQLYTLSAHFKQRAKERFDIESDKCLKWFRQMSGKANEHKEQKCSNANRIAYVTKDGILFILDVKTYKAVTCFEIEKKKKKKKRDLKDILNSPEVNQTDVTQPTIETDTTPIIEITESLPSVSTGSVETFIDDVAKFSSTSTDNADNGFYCLSDNQDTQITDAHISKENKFIDINNNNYATFEEEVLRLERRANLKNAKEFFHVIEEDIERFYKNYQLIKNGVLSDKNYGHLQELNQDIDVIANAFRTLKKLEQNYKILDKNKQSYEQEILQKILLESPKSNESDGFYTKH